MATYLQGVTDYIPQIQPFKPDYNFYQGVLEGKEAQYQAGYDKLSSVYGTLLNSPMLRQGNLDRREKFFNQVNRDIERISAMDLSKEQNVSTAYKVFQPMIDDDFMMKDMAWTKNYQKEVSRSEYFRNCIDEKKCGGKYWQDGVRALNYQAEDFSKSSDQQSLSFSNAKYTPFVNVMEKAMKTAKEMGFSMQSVSWSPDGRYIVTTKGGTQMIMPLNDFFTSVYGNDPQVMDVYKTKAYLSRKDFMKAGISQYGSEEAAEQAYLNSAVSAMNESTQKAINDSENVNDDINNRVDALDYKAKVDGITPGDDDGMVYLYQQLNIESQQQGLVTEKYKEIDSYLNSGDLSGLDLDSIRWRVDGAVANGLFSGDMYNAAATYAELNTEVSIKEDPYALKQFEHGLALQRLAVEQDYKMQYKMWEEEYKRSLLSAPRNNNPFTVAAGTGDTTGELNVYKADKDQIEGMTSLAEQGAEDYVTNGINYYMQLASSSDASQRKIGQNALLTLAGDIPGLKEGLRNGTVNYANALSWFKSHTETSQFKNLEENPYHWNNMYKKMKSVNDVNKPILAGSGADLFFSQNSEMENKYSNGIQAWENFNNVDKQNNTNVVSYLKTGGDPNVKLSDKAKNNLDLYLGPGGQQLSERDYIDAYIKKNQKQYANEIVPTKYGMKGETLKEAHPKYGNHAEVWNALEKDGLAAYKNITEGFARVYNGNKTVGSSNVPLVKTLNSSPVFGGQSGGMTSNATGIGFDIADYRSTGTQTVLGMLDNISKNMGQGVVVTFGTPIEGKNNAKFPSVKSDENALRLLNLVNSGMRTFAEWDDADRMKGTVVYHPIAGGSPDMSAMEFVLDQDIIEKNRGTEKTPGLTYGMTGNTLTVYMPSNQVDNYLKTTSTKGPWQSIMDINGKIELNDPNVGSTSITYDQSTGGYYVTSQNKYFDNGKLVDDNPLVYRLDPTTNMDQIMGQMQDFIKQSSDLINQEKRTYKQSNPNTVYSFNQLNKQGS